ncbi:MAG TPA: hypothetical protein VGE52_14885 [Pirellulales bacterium]
MQRFVLGAAVCLALTAIGCGKPAAPVAPPVVEEGTAAPHDHVHDGTEGPDHSHEHEATVEATPATPAP